MSAFLNSGRSDGWNQWFLSGCFRPKADAQSYSWLAPTAAHARSMQESKKRLNSEDEPPLRTNDPSSETNSESGTSVEFAYVASASAKQVADSLAHCSTSLSLSEGASPLLLKDSGKVHDACSRNIFVAEARTFSKISSSLCEYAVDAATSAIKVIKDNCLLKL